MNVRATDSNTCEGRAHPSVQRAAPAWALRSPARPPAAALSHAAAASHAEALPAAEPAAVHEQPQQASLGCGAPQPRPRSSAVLRAGSAELEPIAENVAEEAGWGGGEWWKQEEEAEEQAEPPYTRLASLSLPASAELPGGQQGGWFGNGVSLGDSRVARVACGPDWHGAACLLDCMPWRCSVQHVVSSRQGHPMPCRAMPCHAVPCHAMPCHTMPYHVHAIQLRCTSLLAMCRHSGCGASGAGGPAGQGGSELGGRAAAAEGKWEGTRAALDEPCSCQLLGMWHTLWLPPVLLCHLMLPAALFALPRWQLLLHSPSKHVFCCAVLPSTSCTQLRSTCNAAACMWQWIAHPIPLVLCPPLQAPTSTSPAIATQEAEAAAAVQQAQQAAEAAAAAFAAEAAGTAEAGGTAGFQGKPAPRPASVENAEGADALLGGGHDVPAAAAEGAASAAGTAGSAGDGGQDRQPDVPAVPQLAPTVADGAALLPIEVQPALPPAELPPALLPAELPPALPPAELPPALPPAELPPALPPIPSEAAAEVPVFATSPPGGASAPAGAPSPAGGTSAAAGASGAPLLSGAMLRSPPRGLEEEEHQPASGLEQSGSPSVIGAAAGVSFGGMAAAAGLGPPVPAASPADVAPPMPESLVEGPLTTVLPSEALPLGSSGLPAPTSFDASAMAAAEAANPTFAAAGGKLGAAFQLRGGSDSQAVGNPFGPATPSIDRPPPPAAAEPANQAAPPGKHCLLG